MTTPTIDKNSEYYDNTMLGAYKDCPRKYYLRHKLHWRSAGTSLPLVFGLSWHDGMDGLWSTHSLDEAMEKFLTTWKANGLPAEMSLEEVEQYGARTPSVAAEMFRGYLKSREKILLESELISMEQPFAVPLAGIDNVWYIGRLDKVVKFAGQTLAIEHKTTTEYKKDGGFRSTYIEGWYSDSQVKGYQYGGSLFFPDLKQVWVDAALVHKKEHNHFRFIPVEHQKPLLMEWVQDTVSWVTKIQEEQDWPKNENQCMGKFGPCPFVNICRTTSNPEDFQGVPDGYVKEKWEPFELLGLDKLTKEPAK